LVDEGLYPKIAARVSGFLKDKHNITDDENEERGEWQELIKDLPEGTIEKPQAKVLFFVGCVASFFPMAQKIPVNMARLMQKAKVDFTILGGEEWCCGFPLIGAGMGYKIQELMDHNMKKVEEAGAESILFTCPSCYHTWKHLYSPKIKIYHASQFLDMMIKEKRIVLKEINAKVTFHDPCDLGRNSGIYEEPREVLRAIPGIELVELAHNRASSMCCGGGGNVEMVNPELSARIAQLKLDEIAKTGADMVVSSCQQCLRTIATRARRQKNPLAVKDLTELVVEAMI
jgi:heterodisulfide reductase subunit D